MALSSQHDEARVILDYFARLPRVGTMIDVGAHFGSSVKPYLNLGWRCVAYEPDATKHERLRSFAGNPQFTLRDWAVGETAADDVPFFTSEESTGIATLTPFRPTHEPAASVRVTTLAADLKALGVTAIDYLKIDAEGHDLQVLRGHDWAIRPKVIMCETDELKARHIGYDFRTLGDYLVDRGYVVWLSQWKPLVRYGGNHAWHAITPYPCELHHPDAWGNYIAVRPDAGVETMRELIAPHTT